MNPAIVIMAYDRPESLQRLLNSLAKAQYPVDQNTPVVISVDRSNNAKVPKMVQNFDWPHGTKKVIHHEERLGIVGNFLFCGGLSEEFGSVIFLEDDFYVSTTFYDYARQALSFYESLDRVAIQSLYALKYNGFTHQPFTPILDSADVFFTQVGWFRGMAVSASQWRRFTGWLEYKSAIPNSQIPDQWQQLGDDEWHPLLSSYLVETDQYFVYPRSSVVTDFSDAGMHFEGDIDLYQANLLLESKAFNFSTLEESIAVYDAFLELLPGKVNRRNSNLQIYDYSMDLNASKQQHQISSEYALTTRPTRNTIKEFSRRMQPLEANVMHSNHGTGISLSRTSDLRWDRRAEWKIQMERDRHFPQRTSGLRKHLKMWLLAWIDKFGLLD